MKGIFNAIKWEFILDVKEYMQYKVGLLLDIIVFTGTYFLIYILGIGQGFTSFYQIDKKSGDILILIGYIFWQNASTALGYSSAIITGECETGIFENRLQGKYSVEVTWFLRLMINCLMHIITYIGIFAYSMLVFKGNSSDFLYMLDALAISFPCLVGMYGIGLILGAICIHEKNIGSLVMIVQTLLLFVSNTLSPSRNDLVYLIPFSSGIEIVRNLYLQMDVNRNLLFICIMSNLFWGIIGILSFRYAVKREKENGTFDNY
jgi:ABC-2 type transport system permease protein